jgi:anti-sigma factor RsiW
VQPIREEELHAFIDGELPSDRVGVVAAALEAVPILAARVAAFAADKAALRAAYQWIGQEAVPAAWIARIQRAAATRPARRRISPRASWAVGLAASLVLLVGSATLLYQSNRPDQRNRPDGSILTQAEAARREQILAISRLTGAALADAPSRDAVLTHAVGLQVRAPDLARLGWKLVEIDTYAKAAALRYRTENGSTLTMFVRPSTGTPRFDLLKTGGLRVCVWQDEVIGAVMMGEMSAGQMMRVAGAAYAALDL